MFNVWMKGDDIIENMDKGRDTRAQNIVLQCRMTCRDLFLIDHTSLEKVPWVDAYVLDTGPIKQLLSMATKLGEFAARVNGNNNCACAFNTDGANVPELSGILVSGVRRGVRGAGTARRGKVKGNHQPTSNMSLHVMFLRTLAATATLLLLSADQTWATDPRFDPTTRMQLVQVPADATVGSVIYRLRATDDDFDYPLHFDLVGDAAKSIVNVESLSCTKFNSVCQANVILKRRLEAGRFYDFKITVRDTKGSSATVSCSISATNATTPKDTIFPHIPGLIMIPEDSKRGADLDYVVARKNPRFTKPVYLELWGSPLFGIRQRLVSSEEAEGTIYLLGPLDYEKQATYHLTVLATDAYAEPGQDSRNIAGLEVVVVVVDVQDMPPVFNLAPPITRLNNSLLPGDIVVKVHAEDGDKGNPRDIRYGLVSEGNPFTPFFNISETTGEIILARPLEEITAISHVGDPIILTVVAEEVRLSRSEPEAMSTTVQLAFILGDRANQPPYFANDNYVARIDENSPQGSTIVFSDPYVAEVSDDDMGKNGVFALTLENNNGTFEISPNVGERHTAFLISVRDNTMLDYETTKTVRFKIVAQELGPVSNLTTSVDVVVFLNDVNDNPPVFLQEEYIAEFPENVTAGMRVIQVTAEDLDTGVYGKIRYTQILGHLNTSLSLDPETGVISIATNNHGFDCEVMPEYRLYVEATDENGNGNRATVPLIIKLIDVNDNAPQFERNLYEFILSPSLNNFTFPAFIKAIDKDMSEPNNEVRYELTHGNYENIFILNDITGELSLRQPLVRKNHRSKRESAEKEAEVYILTARAYDLGVPHLSSTCQVNIYPPESRARTMTFIVPGKNPDKQKTEETLAAVTGGRVIIQEVRPYSGDEVGATDVTAGDTSKERSVVVASVSYGQNSVVDISQLQNQFGRNRTVIVGNTYTEDKSGPYRAESSVLFWLLMLVAFLIILAIIILILCCICTGCPLYMPPKKRIIRVNSTDDDVHLVVKEKGLGKDSKSVQAGRKEAWSADMADSRTRPTHWQFNKRNVHIKDKTTVHGGSEAEDMNGHAEVNSAIGYKSKHIDETRSLHLHEGPHVIYSRELQNRHYRTNERDIYLEDYDGDYNTPKSHVRKRMQADEDLETESLRRHEMERGSDRVYRRNEFGETGSLRKSFRRQQATQDELQDGMNDGRDQLFIREGNTEILRLITRGRQEDERSMTQQQRPVTLVQQPQYILVDSGKHLLMERFIEQQLLQQQEHQNGSKQHSNAPSVILPNETLHTKSEQNQIPVPVQSTKGSESSSISLAETKRTAYNIINHDLLETSLRQQNELLRQILLEKERLEQKQVEIAQQEENRFETQSLPGQSVIAMATQTDCTTSTQTDPQHLRPPKRQIRSDNDESLSEEDDDFHLYIIKQSDDANGIRWMKKRKKLKRRRARDNERRVVAEVRRHIKTPILEESESPESFEKQVSSGKKNYYETRTSMLRKKKNEDVLAREAEKKSESDHNRRSPLKRDVLLEISESLERDHHQTDSPKKKKHEEHKIEYYDSDTEDDAKLYALKAGKLADLFSEDSLDYEMEDMKGEEIGSAKEKRNAVFSRQGSSTEQRESSAHERSRVKSAEKLYTPHDEADEKRKYHSSIDLHEAQVTEAPHEHTSYHHHDAKKVPDKKKVDVTKSTPRYMQWYNKKDGKSPPKKKETEEAAKKMKKTTTKVSKSLLADTKSSSIKKVYPTERKTDMKGDSKKAEEVDKKDVEKKVKKEAEMSRKDSKEEDGTGGKTELKSHPLVQHSEYRFEHPYSNTHPASIDPAQTATTPQVPTVNLSSPKGPTQAQQISVQLSDLPKQAPEKPPRPNLKKEASIGKIGQQTILKPPRVEEDYDSGIAMASLVHDAKKRNQITEKKSIFTIAYDDMHTKQLRPDSTTPPY
ncbi:Cadherin 86C [Carabus blaptoides fortunei]